MIFLFWFGMKMKTNRFTASTYCPDRFANSLLPQKDPGIVKAEKKDPDVPETGTCSAVHGLVIGCHAPVERIVRVFADDLIQCLFVDRSIDVLVDIDL
jgi:hypothetical protein